MFVFVFVQCFAAAKNVFQYYFELSDSKEVLLPQMIVEEAKRLINEYFSSFLRLFRIVTDHNLN